MATRSPTPFHSSWGAFPTVSLPTSSIVQVGDTAFDTTLGQLVVCTAVGSVVWTAVGGGGGSSVWSCDVEPTSDPTYIAAESYQRGGVNPFTQWDPGGVGTYSTVPYGLQLATGATAISFGYLRSLSATANNQAYSITFKIPTENAQSLGTTVFGAVLGRGLIANPATAPLLALSVNYGNIADSGNSVFIFNNTNYATFNVTLKTYNFAANTLTPGIGEFAQAAPGSMFRVSVNKAHTQYCLAISTDGETWFEIVSARNLTTDVPASGVTPVNSFGLFLFNNTALTRRAWIPWCRYRQSATETDVYRNYAPEGGLT